MVHRVIIIGAGPCGLSAAIELKRAGIEALVIEKNCLVHSIYRYPTHLQFFSTPELLEIGDLPFTTPHDKPYRHEALVYYRKAAERYQLNIRTYEEVTSVHKADGKFQLITKAINGHELHYEAQNVVIATGYFDYPNMLNIPGEQLPHVSHYFQEAHPYAGKQVVIIGANNSAVDAALELMRVGAEVTVVSRGAELSGSVKPWVKPIFESMVAKGIISLRTSSQVQEILPDKVIIRGQTHDGETLYELPCSFVLALTGFRPDRKMVSQLGVQLQEDGDKPVFDPHTMETNIPGLYVAGVIASGKNANEIFIETGRDHGKWIAQHLLLQPNI
ncbi:YpdA family putative bacillithiol disulfide reductase [Paenibacillus assamensis]|uniref:YpdA family putative bacillithiol disulfide reductase n=1 Tax=Paenibacillus assamensis TaxID=311244 RepID=UPI000419E8D4|nr:YpdA family putative bacillithiol disulfide reductase [Paenibacillus assamensis]